MSAGQPSYAERIARAQTARDLNAIAAMVARAGLPADVLDVLQVAFARRCRALFPGIVR